MCSMNCDCSECTRMICEQYESAGDTHIFDPDNFYEEGGDDDADA